MATGAGPLEARVVMTVLPDGFAEFIVDRGLSNPTSLDVAPDGRIFVTEQGGSVRIIKDGRLLPDPFVTIPVESTGERGLESIALDPDFEQNGYVYLYYTTASQPIHNRVVRYTARGDAAQPGSESVVIDLDPLPHWLHNGGAMHFGPDDKLYIAVGDGLLNSDQAQEINSFFGKILRINPDGTIPPDNPFVGQAQGRYQAVYALGFRNPFTFAIQPGTGRLFVNDVGAAAWEEIDAVEPGGNYGWPLTEGPTDDPRFVSPLHAYPHSGDGWGCAITGGVFYDPDTPPFPGDYAGSYFFLDFCNGTLQRLDPTTGAVRPFATDLPDWPVDLDMSPDGGLYFLTRGEGAATPGNTGGALHKIEFPSDKLIPRVVSQPGDLLLPVAGTATFRAAAFGEEPLAYQWQRDGVDIPGANGAELVLSRVRLADNGSTYRLVVRNARGEAVSEPASLKVVKDQAPMARIVMPRRRRFLPGLGRVSPNVVQPGETIRLAALASDRRDRRLAPAAFSWHADLRHNTHAHPLVPETAGTRSLQFTVPTDIHEDGAIWYRVTLSVTDSSGLSTEATLDLYPSDSSLAAGLIGAPRTRPSAVRRGG